jgi:hypothetical protein
MWDRLVTLTAQLNLTRACPFTIGDYSPCVLFFLMY